MLRSLELARLLVRLARASKPTYYEVGPSYHQELDIANGSGSARIIKYYFANGSKRYIIYKPYSNRPMLAIPLSKALELRDANNYEEVCNISGVGNVLNSKGIKWRDDA